MGTRALLLQAVLILALPPCSWGDGKFYGREAVPPGIPYQRALVLFDGAREALIVQSKYSMDGKHGAADFGWVVPVPAVPDLPVVERYVRQGWCFAAARVAPDSAQKMRGHDGLADPLVLVFPSRQAIYPLALTGTGGFNTEVLLYVAAHQPLKDDGRLGLHFAGTCPRGHDLFAGVGSSRAIQVLSPLTDGYPALMKLKGTLSPAQMQTDLVLTPDPNRRDYRERRWVW